MKRKINKAALWSHLAFVALEALRDNDGSMPLADLLSEVYKRAGDKIPEDAKESYSSGATKWKNKVQFESDFLVKAGFLRKERGVWHLTSDGEKALPRGEGAVMKRAKAAYREWQARRRNNRGSSADGERDDDIPSEIGMEEYESTAMSGIQNYIRDMDPYKFQDLCAALLRGMDYHVRDVAPPGPDGGIDVLAYTDPLGGRPPRLKVQVKHSHKTGKPALSQLAGLLTDGDIGVFVSSAGFASGCREFARNSGKHLELIDIGRFVDLWQKHYDKLSETDKSLLPLRPVYFLDKQRAGGE